MVLPETSRSSRRNCNPAFLLLAHPVHRRRPFMDFTNAVDLFCIEEDTLGSSRLTSVNMSNDTDISCFLEREFSGQGATIRKREETHKMAESNKAFAHYRW